MKRFLCLFLMVCLLCALLPASTVPVLAASDADTAYPVEGGNLYFDKDTGAITGCDRSVTAATSRRRSTGSL